MTGNVQISLRGLLCACIITAALPVLGEDLPTYMLASGRWFTGDSFEDSIFYVRDGSLTRTRPERVDSLIDLAGGFVVPPYGEAHTHRPALPQYADGSIEFFLNAGIFYVMNHGSMVRFRTAFDSLTNRPNSVDARFANALLASPQSHGVELWQRLIKRGGFSGIDSASLEGDAYFILEEVNDLERRWPQILATNPDFIKIMIEYSEEYEARKEDPRYFGISGLNPQLVPHIVSLAHGAGLRVSAHIETAADFHLAVSAGADIIAQLPGYDIPEDLALNRYRIRQDDAREAARRGTIVVTTTLLSVDRAEADTLRLQRIQETQRFNLELLSSEGVRLAIGSDLYSRNAVDEALHLAEMAGFDHLTILRMLSVITPRAIFPERRIGHLGEGAEASLLVPGGNPLHDLAHLRDIRLRIKDGVIQPSK